MYRHRGLWTGIFLLLILAGCSKDKTLNVEGAFSPVIANLASDHEPAVRGISNAMTAVITNPRGYPIQYLWRAGAGTLAESTSETVHWTPPDARGTYPLTITVTAHDDLNNVDFQKTRTFQVVVENEFERWTNSSALQFDVAPPVGGKIYYSETRNVSTGESDVWALSAPLGTPEQITHDFFTATSPTVQSDGSRVVFLGKRRGSDGGPSIWLIPPTGGDTVTALPVSRFDSNNNHFLIAPRFAPTGPRIVYSTDSLSQNFGRPKPWVRDVSDFAQAPVPLMEPTDVDGSYAFINPGWSGDSIVVESYADWQFANVRQFRGLFKLNTAGTPPVNPEPPGGNTPWLNDLTAFEPDWSPDGQHIIFTRRAPGSADRDIWIINAHASNPASAIQVTSGLADDFHPRFSSDGTAIFFVSNRANRYGLNGVYDTERRGTNIWSVRRFDLP